MIHATRHMSRCASILFLIAFAVPTCMFAPKATSSPASSNYIPCKTTQEFDEILKNELVVVKFSATWCGPCKAFAPTFHNAAKEYPDIKFVTVDVDEASALSSKYKVSCMPTTIFFKNGKSVVTETGNLPKVRLDMLLSQLKSK